ncbi:MAG TPA: ATP-binding protein [Oculatellaceae cyanobacterium]
MNVTATQDWQTANQQYLMAAVALVREALEQQVARVQNQQPPPTPLGKGGVQSIVEAAAAAMPAPSALEQLCTTFGLSGFDRDVLLLCAGMEFDPSFASLCADAQADPQRPYPTFSLALAALPTPHWSAITPNAPLRRWRLIEVGAGQVLTLSPLRIDERVLHYLVGEQYLERQLVGVVRPIQARQSDSSFPLSPSHPLQPSHQVLVEQLAAIWSEAETLSELPVVQLCGDEVAGKRAIASAVCALLGYNLNVMYAHVLPPAPDDLNQLMQLWEREAVLSSSALLLDCDEVTQLDGARVNAIQELVESITTPLIVTTRDRIQVRQRPVITFDVPNLTKREQRAIWQNSLGTAASELNGQVEALVSHFNLSMPAIQAACTGAMGKVKGKKLVEQDLSVDPYSLHSDANDLGTALWDICRAQARPRLEDLAQRIESASTWEDLVLPEAQRQILRDIAAHVKQRTKVYESWGFAGKSGRGLGISALFAGASGTGKTMAAEVLARELRLDVYRIDLSAVVSKYIGETEKNLRRVFDAAEMGGAILLFDEADALFGKRSEVKDSHDRHANIEVSYLLQRMESYQGLSILTTNLKDTLDSAFLRRIRFVVRFPFPDAIQRTEIWRRVFPSEMPKEAIDEKKLARLNVAGGNIRSIALNAAFIAADAGEPVMMKHILSAAQSEYIKLEKTLTDTEVKGWI